MSEANIRIPFYGENLIKAERAKHLHLEEVLRRVGVGTSREPRMVTYKQYVLYTGDSKLGAMTDWLVKHAKLSQCDFIQTRIICMYREQYGD